MSGEFTLSVSVAKPFAQALASTRDALADQGFGIITEIDLAAILKAKIGAQIPAQVILGACRPQLAHQAILADPAIAALLPCNVVVRALTHDTCVVEAFDPEAMSRIAENDTMAVVAADARTRLIAALAAIRANDKED
jgi:uncharacterized protein (DUF302 family)